MKLRTKLHLFARFQPDKQPHYNRGHFFRNLVKKGGWIWLRWRMNVAMCELSIQERSIKLSVVCILWSCVGDFLETRHTLLSPDTFKHILSTYVDFYVPRDTCKRCVKSWRVVWYKKETCKGTEGWVNAPFVNVCLSSEHFLASTPPSLPLNIYSFTK